MLVSWLFVSYISVAQEKLTTTANITADNRSRVNKNISDSALLDLVEKQTFRYFWDFADPVSGMARERSNIADYGPETVTTGGTGFGIMSMIAAANRSFISRTDALNRIQKIVSFFKCQYFKAIYLRQEIKRSFSSEERKLTD